MSCMGTVDCDCGCCAGTSVQTPARELNAAGLSALAYRVGTWSSFKESMLARLSSSDYPALQPLKTRSDDDFTIAFLDAGAVMLDILTFYQERLANESYLRTAGQLRSLTELSRLIGYTPAPGVSASTYLAFALKQAPGQTPDPSAPPITIPQGTQVQSVPPQGKAPQTFETSADVLAKPDWSALQVQTGLTWTPPGSNGIYLSGTTTQLKPGDSLLILGADRENWPPGPTPSEQWDIVVLNKVETDTTRNLTYVEWDSRIAHWSNPFGPAPTWGNTAKIFAFRQKARLFGHNAPDPQMFVNATTPPTPSFPALINSSESPWQWNNFNVSSSSDIILDATYQQVVADGWFALIVDGWLGQFSQLYQVARAITVSQAAFTLGGKVTQLSGDYDDPQIADARILRNTDVWAQSDELQIAEQPLTYPLYGTNVQLESRRMDLAGVQVIAVTGKRQKIALAAGVAPLQFTADDGSTAPVNPGDVLTLLVPPAPPANGTLPDWSTATGSLTLTVEDAAGRAGTITAALADFILAPSDKNDPQVSECALVASVDSTTDPAHTALLLQSPLLNCYDRTVTTVNANVVLATHGQSVSEIMGSGNASTPNQRFKLRQSPLTYVQATTSSGRTTTLETRVNGVDWTLVPSLYEQGPSLSVYTSIDQPGGATDVLFGDGIEGAVLPTGTNNIQASYRIGSGSAGNVGAGTLTTLMDRPLGVSGVVNPQAATGGQDAQSVDDVRSNAPRTVLTLGRVVSVTDYQNFARSFAGIDKANAIWIPSGPGRGVFLTVAGAGGAALPPGNSTLGKLTGALQACGNPLIPITVLSFVETLFSFSASIVYDPARDATAVEAAVRETLTDTFSFAARSFGQAVGIDEITAVIQSVAGVIAVNVTGLTRGAISSTGGDLASLADYSTITVLNNWNAQKINLVRPFADPPGRLCAFLPVADVNAVPQPAEILVLDPRPSMVTLGAMS